WNHVATRQFPAVMLAALSERAAQDAGQHQQAGKPVLTPAEMSRVQKRARAYLAKLPPAIEGHGGDKQTFTAACHLILDFGLSPPEALPLLREYNERCRPRWTEAELIHKLQEADKRTEPRGTLLNPSSLQESGSGQDQGVQGGSGQDRRTGQAFVAAVPDFILADWIRAQPRWEPRNSESKRK